MKIRSPKLPSYEWATGFINAIMDAKRRNERLHLCSLLGDLWKQEWQRRGL